MLATTTEPVDADIRTTDDELSSAGAALYNIETLADVLDRHSEELQRAADDWLIERVRSYGRTMHRICMVLRDEQTRAKEAVQRLLDGDA